MEEMLRNPVCLPKRDNISRFIYLHQDIFICIKFHISVLRFVYIYQEVNLSETRFRYTYQDLHTRIKIRKYLLNYAYVHQDLHTSRFLHIYIKIHIYIEIMTGFHEVLSQMVCLVTLLICDRWIFAIFSSPKNGGTIERSRIQCFQRGQISIHCKKCIYSFAERLYSSSPNFQSSRLC